MVEIHRQQGTGDLQIQCVQRVMRTFAAVGDISTIGIGTCVSALNTTDVITGSPFTRQDATVNVISRRPHSGETEYQREFVTLVLAEHFANGIGVAPQVFGVVTLHFRAVLSS